MDAETRDEAVLKDAETRAAFHLARGLAADGRAVNGIVRDVAKRSQPPAVRGYGCIALALLGAPGMSADLIELALRERKSDDLRRDVLLDQFRKPNSPMVHAEITAALARIGSPGLVDVMAGILDDPKQPVAERELAAVCLGRLADPRDVPAVARLATGFNYRAWVVDVHALLFCM